MVWENKLSQPPKLHKEVMNSTFGGMKFPERTVKDENYFRQEDWNDSGFYR